LIQRLKDTEPARRRWRPGRRNWRHHGWPCAAGEWLCELLGPSGTSVRLRSLPYAPQRRHSTTMGHVREPADDPCTLGGFPCARQPLADMGSNAPGRWSFNAPRAARPRPGYHRRRDAAASTGGPRPYAACCSGHDARHVVTTTALLAFPNCLDRRARQIRNCVMIHRPTTDITRAIITPSNTAAIAHIIEGSIGKLSNNNQLAEPAL